MEEGLVVVLLGMHLDQGRQVLHQELVVGQVGDLVEDL